MTEGNRSAVDVDFGRVEPELADDRERLRGKRFVQLDDVNLIEA